MITFINGRARVQSSYLTVLLFGLGLSSATRAASDCIQSGTGWYSSFAGIFNDEKSIVDECHPENLVNELSDVYLTKLMADANYRAELENLVATTSEAVKFQSFGEVTGGFSVFSGSSKGQIPASQEQTLPGYERVGP